MRFPMLLSIVTMVAIVPVSVRADGLIFRLPQDGASVQYDMTLKAGPAGNQRDGSGTFTMSSVGKAVVNNEDCRWIETKMIMKFEDREMIVLAKLLIPEKELGKGKSPGEHVVRGWIKHGDQEVRELNDLKDPKAGPLVAFFAGAMKNVKELEKIEVESKLGKLPCAGQSGEAELQQGENTIVVGFENRLHEKAPFGVVTSELKFQMRRNGEDAESGTVTLKLAEVGTTALSELPDRN
jgi:hypothetical protein